MIINTLKKKIFIKKNLSFIYSLRYLILIFVFSIILFFSIPKLFNYVNKIDDLNNILKNQHSFTIDKTDKIKYIILPQPGLEINNANILIGDQSSKLLIKKMTIFTNISGFYNSEKIFVKKIVLEEAKININNLNYRDYLKFLTKNSIEIKSSLLSLGNKVVSIKNINLKKNKKKKVNFNGNFLGNDIIGYYIDKKKNNLFYLKIKNLGIESKIYFDKKTSLLKPSGSMKLKVLNNNFLINFDYNQYLKFQNSTYKNKNILTNLSGQLNFEPFFYFKVLAEIKKINLKNIDLKKFYSFMSNAVSNKKLNGDLTIDYSPKKIIGKTKTKTNKLRIIFRNGDIISKNINLNFADLNIGVNFNLKKYPMYKDLNYELFITTENIQNFFGIIDYNNKELNRVNALIKGNINLDAQKYYFEKIIINKKKYDEKILKDYLDKNSLNFFNKTINKRNIYLFLKDLFEII